MFVATKPVRTTSRQKKSRKFLKELDSHRSRISITIDSLKIERTKSKCIECGFKQSSSKRLLLTHKAKLNRWMFD